jgi:hypothetical protein
MLNTLISTTSGTGGIRKAPKRGKTNILIILTGLTGFLGLFVSLFPEERVKGQYRLRGRNKTLNYLTPSLFLFFHSKRDKTFCLSSGKAK